MVGLCRRRFRVAPPPPQTNAKQPPILTRRLNKTVGMKRSRLVKIRGIIMDYIGGRS